MGYVWDIYGLYIELVFINCGPTVDQQHSKGIGFAWFLHGVVIPMPVERSLEKHFSHLPVEHDLSFRRDPDSWLLS
jgi:hypothetical protein